MNQQIACCVSAKAAKCGLLAILIAGGVAGIFYLSGGWSGTNASPAPVTKKDEPVETSKAHRIPLSTFDIKDHNEAPDLAADAQGRVYLAWSSQTGADERAVFLSRTDANSEKFGEPTTVSRSGIVKTVSQMKGKTITRESKMLPHLAIHNENIHLNWVEALPGNQSVRMKVATSTDAGDHFGPAKVVFNGDKTRPTFTAMTVGADGTIACTWLDNRERAQQPVVAVRNPGDAVFEPALSLHPGQDGRGTCPCCPTATVIGPDGTVYIAFRNIEDGYRDFAICRKKPGQDDYDGPISVIPQTWKFDGCPQNGASMAIVGDFIHIVWMDARTGTQRCYYAKAKLVDMQFEARELTPSSTNSQGNAKMFADADGVLHIVWEESLGAEPKHEGGVHQHGTVQVGGSGGRAIMYACMRHCCGKLTAPKAVSAKQGAFQTRPSIVGTPNGDIFVAWNELDESGKAIVVQKLSGGEKP